MDLLIITLSRQIHIKVNTCAGVPDNVDISVFLYNHDTKYIIPHDLFSVNIERKENSPTHRHTEPNNKYQ